MSTCSGCRYFVKAGENWGRCYVDPPDEDNAEIAVQVNRTSCRFYSSNPMLATSAPEVSNV